MAAITEDYISFETAKLLKEKGFNCETDMYYSPEGERCCWMPNGKKSWLDNKGKETWWWKCVSPTLQMAMKWFLKKYNIFICILFLEESDGYGYTIENVVKKKYIATSKNSSYKEPEEACEAEIKYCLEHLI